MQRSSDNLTIVIFKNFTRYFNSNNQPITFSSQSTLRPNYCSSHISVLTSAVPMQVPKVKSSLLPTAEGLSDR